ncbi:F-BAR and double SH3 domains protein 1 isoform X2 [Amphiprion ocellaris]|uniref:F-BAR and double SH3 domains protein 1 isoform X2 n=1 Tax=Amphiprion ocellaris TaxID=80972 RepID=UPI002410E099|nr:F-BAR and double SH3 domains protein 1 isoform X2 [Amphiprion ocellaris]
MQPPPRKVKESQQVKLLFSEQLSKLQMKQHQDSELLEEIRSFSKQRAAIEKDYSQALQRLAVQFQKRDWQRGNTDAVSSGSVFAVWRSVVDATAQTAASRLAAGEQYRTLIGQVSRSLRNAKDVRAKRGLEQLQKVQAELVEALRELQRLKKSYQQVNHIAGAAREKAEDAQSRSRKSEHGIFHFKTGLHKMAAKLVSRLKESDDRLTEVRNEYLLTLAAVNAHQKHYYSTDLPRTMAMDGGVYDDLRSYFTLLCGTEMEACLNTHQQYGRIWDSVVKVTRDRNVQQFLQESASFSKSAEFSFQPAPRDQVFSLQEVCPDDEAGLVKEAKKWIQKAAKDFKITAHGQRALQMLESRLKLLSGETGLSVEQKISEVQENIRKAKLSRVKAEARLALLAQSIAGTERWLQEAMDRAEQDLETERRLSEQRKSTEDFSEDEFELTDFEDYEDENADIFADPVSASEVCVYPAACRVVYSYQASQSDELSITEGEELEVIEDGDVEDWLKVCNSCGQVGYVPERYVQFLCLPADDATQLDGSFSSTSPTGSKKKTGSRGVVRALYSYQAQSAEELSFQEGALIHLICCRHGQVDDGFWEGELDGQTGFFPSLVVELLQDEGEEEEEEDPPVSSRPPLIPPAFSMVPPAGVEVLQLAGSVGDSPEPSSGRLRPVSSGSTSAANVESVQYQDSEIISSSFYPSRTLHSQTAGLLVVPRISKSRMGGRAFSYQAPLLWNQLPVWVREADTLSIFKTRLKTFLFDKAYS